MLDFTHIGKPEPKLTVFPTESKGICIIRGLEVRSMCAHHLAPFFGKCTIAYYPNENEMAGLSKFQRVLDYIAMQPSEQETLTKKVADYLISKLNPKGLIVSMECCHTCMVVRGVQTSGATTETIETYGTLKNLSEAINIIRK